MSCSTKTRGSGVAEDLDQLCPVVENFDRQKLPLLKEVIGNVKYYINNHHQTTKESLYIAATNVREHWIHCNIYPFSHSAVYQKLELVYKAFRNLDNTSLSKRKQTWKAKWIKLKPQLDTCFDIFQKKRCRKK